MWSSDSLTFRDQDQDQDIPCCSHYLRADTSTTPLSPTPCQPPRQQMFPVSLMANWQSIHSSPEPCLWQLGKQQDSLIADVFLDSMVNGCKCMPQSEILAALSHWAFSASPLGRPRTFGLTIVPRGETLAMFEARRFGADPC